MTDKEELDRTKMTFSQAEGLVPLPEPLKLGELSQEARALLWKIIHDDLRSSSGHVKYQGTRIMGRWKNILYYDHVFVSHLPADDFTVDYSYHKDRLKKLILHGAFNEIFDFLQHVMRHKDCLELIPRGIKWVFDTAQVAYTVDIDTGTIIAAVTQEEGVAIKQALRTSSDAGLDGAKSHLVAAGKELNAGNYAGCVRESISAVESVAKRLTNKNDATLSPALTALSPHVAIHKDMLTGFMKLYHYSSDEKGIRHALLSGTAKVDREDAVFMLGACASFVTYLIGKGRTAGILK